MCSREPNIVKIAVEICTDEEFKRKIVEVPNIQAVDPQLRKTHWTEAIEVEAQAILQIYNYGDEFEQKVLGTVLCIAMRMLSWVEYYRGTFDLSLEYCLDLLKPELFTPVGIIDERKVAIVLAQNTNLSSMQQFKLACHYCLKERIPLFKRLTAEEKASLYNSVNPSSIKQPRLVKFWSYFVMGDIDKLKEDKSVDQYKLECAVGSGSIVAVQYCLEKTSLMRKRDAIIEFAVEVVKHRMQRGINALKQNSKVTDDWIVFSKEKYNSSVHSWVPNHFFADIFYYLISKLTPAQKTDMARRIFIAVKSDKFPSQTPAHSRVLEHFLFWPHQDQFMELMHLSWRWLPDRAYGNMLLEIFDRIEMESNHLCYGEHLCYDYRRLLMAYWISSPDNFKRYVFSDKKRSVLTENKTRTKDLIISEAKQLLMKMFQLENFNPDDMENIRVILNDATVEEKASFLVSEDGGEVCMILLESERFDLFDEILQICCPTLNDAIEFKKRYALIMSRDPCLKLVREGRLEAVDAALTAWCELTDDEIQKLKISIMGTFDARSICRQHYFKDLDLAENFITWGFNTEDSIRDYKKTLLEDHDGFLFCKLIVFENSLHRLDSILNWCFQSPEEISMFKEQLPFRENFSICEDLILYTKFDGRVPSTSGQNSWKPVDVFLEWTRVLQEDLLFKFKLHENIGENILFKLIESGQWDKADEYFSWLDFSDTEIKDVKKEKFYGTSSLSEFFDDILNGKEGDGMYAVYGSKENAIEKFLEWFLFDLDAVKEFRARYRRYESNEFIRKVVTRIETSLQEVENMELDSN